MENPLVARLPRTNSLRTLVSLLVLLLAASGADAQQPSRFTGEPISLNLKDVDIRDFLRLMHEISGLNIVVGPGVRGAVTLAIEDVPWDQVLDIVLRNQGLLAEAEGRVMRVITREMARSEYEVTRTLAEAAESSAPVRTVLHRLSYSRASEVAPILRKFLSKRGEIAVDERTNTLIITDTPASLNRLPIIR